MYKFLGCIDSCVKRPYSLLEKNVSGVAYCYKFSLVHQTNKMKNKKRILRLQYNAVRSSRVLLYKLQLMYTCSSTAN